MMVIAIFFAFCFIITIIIITIIIIIIIIRDLFNQITLYLYLIVLICDFALI